MAPEMSKDEIDQAVAGCVTEREGMVTTPQQGNGQAATLSARLDEFLGPVATVMVNGTSASLMQFFPLDQVVMRLVFLFGRSVGAGFQAPNLGALFKFRAEMKKQFEAGLNSVPASVALSQAHAQQPARPPG